MEGQTVLANLDLVARAKHHLIDPLTIDVGSVEGPSVAHKEGSPAGTKVSVPP